MSIKVNVIKCPECGATLSVEDGRDKLFCSYCGTPIILTNENEYTFHHIDDADIKRAEADKLRAETDRMLRLRQLELSQKRFEKKSVARRAGLIFKVFISIILGIIMLTAFGSSGFSDDRYMVGGVCGLILLLIWSFEILKIGLENESSDDGKIKVPSGIANFERKTYYSVEETLKGAGFSNIHCIPLKDLRVGIFYKPDTVESITINGQNISSSGKRFPPDASVVISYHSFQS